MANEIGNLDIRIQAEADLTKALQQINASFATITKEAEKTGREINTSLSTAFGQSGWIGSQVKNATTVGKAYTDQFKPGVDAAAQAIAKLHPELTKSDTNLRQLSADLGTFGTRADTARKVVDPLAKNFWLLSAGMQKIMSVLVPVTAAISAFTGVAIASYAELEKATDDLQASLGTTEEIAQTLQKQFQGLSTEMPVTTKEFLTMAKSAAEAGVAEKYLLTFTNSMAKLQSITKELDISNVSEALVNISKAFNISLGDIDKTISVLRATAKASSATMGDFVDSLRRASPSARTLGVSLQETSAILGTLIPVQESAERTGTRLNEIFVRMATRLPDLAGQMGVTKEQLRSMIDEDATNTLLTYIDRLGQLTSKTQQVEAATKIFGEQGEKAIVALIGRTDEIRASITNLNEEFKTAKTFTDDYNIAVDNLSSQFKILQNTSTVALQSLGADLAPLISQFVGKLTNAIRTLVAIWLSIPEPVRQTIASLALLVTKILVVVTAVAGLGLALVVLKSGFLTSYRSVLSLINLLAGPLITSLAKSRLAIAAFGLIAKASFWEISLIIAGVIGAIYLLSQAIGALNIKLPDFGGMITKAFKLDNLNVGFDKINDALVKLQDTTDETTTDIENSFGALNASALKWGNEFINNYIDAFSKADFAILNDVSSIVEQYYDIQQKAGEQSAEQAIINTERTRGIVARAISDIKEMGTVSQEVLTNLQGQIGAERTQSIVKEITSALKIEDINASIDAIKDQIDERQKKLKEETNLIEDEIKQVEDTYEPRVKAQETIIKDLEKQKKDLEAVYKTELKIYETQVNTAQENLESAKDALDSLKKLRDKEVDSAEGMVDYAKMNLDAAQNALKRETILGNNEFDATFRAAEARVKAAEQTVELAQTSYLKTKKSADQEVQVAQDEIDILDKKYDIVKDNLSVYKDSYQEEVDVLEEKINLAKDNLETIKDAQSEAIDILKEEKDLLQNKYDKEVNILEERQDILQKSLDAEQEVYDKIKSIRDEYLRNVNAQLQGIKDAASLKLPDITGGGGLETPTTTEIESTRINVKTNKKSIFEMIFGKSREDVNKEMQETGQSFAKTLLTSFLEQNFKTRDEFFSDMLGLIFGKNNLKKAQDDAKINGKSVSTNLINGLIDDLNTKVSQVRETINRNVLTPINEKIEIIKNLGTMLGRSLIIGWETGLNTLSNVGTWINNSIIEPIKRYFEGLYNNAYTWGSNLLTGFLNGINNKYNETINTIGNFYESIANKFRNFSNNASTWGRNLIVSFANGILDGIVAVSNAVGWLGRTISNMLKSQSPPKEGPLSTIDEWGIGLMKTYASSLTDGLPYIENSIADISKAIKSPLEAMNGVSITSDLNKNMSSPIASTPITNVTQEGNKTFSINPGIMIASEGEIRSFARMLKPYLEIENQRIAGGQNG